MLRALLLLAIFASTCAIVSALGNCSQITPTILTAGRQRYSFGGLGVTLQPMVGSQVSDDYRVEWNFAYLTERNRTLNLISGEPIGYSRCISPSDGNPNPLVPVSNPLAPGIPTQGCSPGFDVPCGALLSYFRGEDLDCWMEAKVEPFFNVTRSSHYVHYSSTSSPDFRFTAGFHLTDKNITVYPLANSTVIENVYTYDFAPQKTALNFIFFAIFTPTYMPDIKTLSTALKSKQFRTLTSLFPSAGLLKITYEINNFSWAGTDDYVTGNFSDSSWLEVWFNTSVTVGPGSLNISSVGDKRTLRYESTQDSVFLLVEVDSSFILDSTPFLEPNVTQSPFTISTGVSISLDLSSTVSLCSNDVGHWQQAIYDPTLGFLFSLSEDPAPHGKSQKFAGWRIAIIIIFVIVALVIIAGAVYAFAIMPRLRASKSKVLQEHT